MTAVWLGLEWSRPWAFLLLSLPALLLLLARRIDRPPELATGTLDVWARIPRSTSRQGGGARERIPPAILLLALALTLGALALAGPVREGARPWRTWQAIVDRSPSMYASLGRASRLERAVALAEEWLARNAGPGDEIVWVDGGSARKESVRGSAPPRAWLASPPAPQLEPAWNELDRDGALWVTDRAPDPPPKRAGVFASGGPAEPGPVAVEGRTRVDWDGERLVEVKDGARERIVVVQGRELPPVLARVLRAWADARGLFVRNDATSEKALGVYTNVSGESHVVEAGRDGWSARGEAGELAAVAELETWLADPSGRALVASGPGRVDSAWTAMEEPLGDPAAFAVSWAALFDRAALPPRDVVDLRERLAAGEEWVRPPAAFAAGHAERSGRFHLAPWLALVALVATCGAWIAARHRRPLHPAGGAIA